LDKVKILKGFDENDKPILVEKKNKITLRMLLSHTGMFSLPRPSSFHFLLFPYSSKDEIQG
jgi:CubicO group peptidase (beta-lactamase class C family)